MQASFNRVTVDGDTSTNDACVLVATGRAGTPEIGAASGADYEALCETVTAVSRWLAQALIRDAEGATKFVEIVVNGGRDEGECLRVAYTVAESPLVKTALYAADANWGRILAAIGRAGLAELDIGRVDVDLGEVRVVEGGQRSPAYREALGQAVLAREEVRLVVSLGRGSATTTVWTCDLSHDYVRINAEYRT